MKTIAKWVMVLGTITWVIISVWRLGLLIQAHNSPEKFYFTGR